MYNSSLCGWSVPHMDEELHTHQDVKWLNNKNRLSTVAANNNNPDSISWFSPLDMSKKQRQTMAKKDINPIKLYL